MSPVHLLCPVDELRKGEVVEPLHALGRPVVPDVAAHVS